MVKVKIAKLWDINWLMGYRDAQWYIKDTWISFSARNIAKQATTVHYTFYSFLGLGIFEMEKLLPVACKWLRKQKF